MFAVYNRVAGEFRNPALLLAVPWIALGCVFTGAKPVAEVPATMAASSEAEAVGPAGEAGLTPSGQAFRTYARLTPPAEDLYWFLILVEPPLTGDEDMVHPAPETGDEEMAIPPEVLLPPGVARR